MLYIRHFYNRPQRAVVFSLLVLLLGIILLSNFHNRTGGLIGSSAAPVCVTPPSGLKAWYPGEGNANDIQGPTFVNGNLLNGASASTPGEVGNAFSFDGSNDFVDVPNNPKLEPSAGVTVDMWVKSSSPGSTAYLVAKGAQGCSYASYSIDNAGTGGGLAFDLFTSGSGFVRSPVSSTTVFDGNWHHVAGTYDGASVRLYVDGAQVGAGTAATGSIAYGLATTNNLTFGRFNGTCTLSYAGLLDEIEIFDRALTLAEVQSIFNAGTAGKCKCVPPPSGLKAWYQGEGNANDIKGPTFENGSLLNGASASTPGEVGNAFSFDGSNDYVDVPNSSALEPASGVTVDLWVKSSSPGSAAYLVAKGAQVCSYASYSINNGGTGGGLAFDIVTSGSGFVRSPFSSATVFDGNWHHVAGTYDGFFVRLYVDGVQVPGATAASGTIVYNLATTNNLTFGRFNGTCILSYAGLLDEIEIFDRALTPTEIQSLFSAGSTGKCPPSVSPTPTPTPTPGPTTTELSIVKDDFVTNVLPSSLVTYTITVTNNGSSVTGALVNDIFPSTITGVSWTCTPSSGADCLGTFGSGNIVSKPVNLNTGSSVVFTVTGTVSSMAVGSISNTATITPPAGVTDTNMSNNSSTDTDTVGPAPASVDLTMTPTSCGALVRGQTGSMQLRIGNNGPSMATGVMSTTTLPNTVDLCSTSSTFLGVSCTSSVNFLGQTIVKCDFQTIASAGFKTVRINFRPRCTAPSPIVTSNTVWSNEFELVPRNNSLGTSSNATGSCVVPSPCSVPGTICP